MLLERLHDDGQGGMTFYPILSRRDSRGRTLLHYAVGQLKDSVVAARFTQTNLVDTTSRNRGGVGKLYAGWENNCTDLLREIASAAVHTPE